MQALKDNASPEEIKRLVDELRTALSRYLQALAAQAQTWNLVWSDEFNGSSVNTGNWTFETGGHGWGNQELEMYTNGANASVANGIRRAVSAPRITQSHSNYLRIRLGWVQ